ncbi:hypothetical protein B1790_30065 [Mycobacterium sp. AT1]|nr:hypothetical protein B1790_30065 [Mycobacterium sp. AT1]
MWHAFKIGSDVVVRALERAIADAADITGPEFGVLDRLDLAGGEMRQSDLAESMRWHKSRLSHQITRMTARKLLTRSAVAPTTSLVTITKSGRHKLELARPAHAKAIREHLLSRFPTPLRDGLIVAFADEMT